MKVHRHLKIAAICTVALAVPTSAGTAGLIATDAPPAKKARIYRHVCPINNPDYVAPKSTRR
jgi:hypothetical protein